MADETVIPVEVDTGDSEQRLKDLASASEQAGEALDKLDGGGLDKVESAAGDAERAVGELADEAARADSVVTVEVEFDEAKARDTATALGDIDTKGRGMADGVGFGNNALRDLLGPLGDGIGPAGDYGDAMEGLGDIVGGLAGKLGLGQAAIGKLSGAIAGGGVAIAAIIAVYSLWKKSQDDNTEAAKKLLETQQKLRDGKFEDAAAELATQWGEALDAADSLGISAGTFLKAVQGQVDLLPQLDRQLGEIETRAGGLDTQFGQFATTADGELYAALNTVRQALIDQGGAWATNEANITGNATRTAELEAALRGVEGAGDDAASSVENISKKFDALTRKLSEANAIEDVRDAFDAVEDAAVTAWVAGVEGATDAERKARDYQQAIRDAIDSVLGLQEELDNVPDETIAEIAVMIQEGDIEGARARIDELAATIPPLALTLDTSTLDAQMAAWIRNSGPGSNSMSPTAPPSVDPTPDTVGRMREGYVNVTNYYPPAIDPFGVTQASTEYVRVQVGP